MAGAGPRVFLSYRREDTSGHAGRIYDELAKSFGPSQVFMDVDALEPGADFPERLQAAVGATDVLVAVIGRQWLDTRDEVGARRLDNPDDFVRIEIAAALERGILVIPVLVGGTSFPTAAELPDALKPLARRHALVLSDLDWRSGIRRLVAALERALATAPARPRPEPWTLTLGVASALLLLTGTALRWDAIVHPDFGKAGTVPFLALATAPAPLAVAAAALLAGTLHAAGPHPLFEGALLGVAVAGVAKYAAVLTLEESRLAAAAALAGSALLCLFATRRIAKGGYRDRTPLDPAAVVLALAGAALVLAATKIPFNIVVIDDETAVVLERGWDALEPIVIALAVVAVVLFGWRFGREAAAGALLGLGLASALLWMRYVGVPLLQMAQVDGVASVQEGGFVGLAGSVLIVVAGALTPARQRADVDVPGRIAGA